MNEQGKVNHIDFDKKINKLNLFVEKAKNCKNISELKDYFKKEVSVSLLPILNFTGEDLSTVYRSRLVSDIKEDENINSPTPFSYIPLSKKELVKRQRLNLEYSPIFYSSLTPFTNLKELKINIHEMNEVYISRWNIERESTFVLFPILMPEKFKSTLSGEIKEFDEKMVSVLSKIHPCSEKYVRRLGEIILESNQTDSDSCYLASAIIADFIFNISFNLGKNHRVEAILYPSVLADSGNYNIAFTPAFVDSSMKLDSVFKSKIKKDGIIVDCSVIGKCDSNKIKWKHPFLYQNDIQLKKYTLFNRGKEINPLDIKGVKIESDQRIIDIQLFMESIFEDNLQDLVNKRYFSEMSFTDKSFESIKQTTIQILIKGANVIMPNGQQNITSIEMTVNYKNSLID